MCCFVVTSRTLPTGPRHLVCQLLPKIRRFMFWGGLATHVQGDVLSGSIAAFLSWALQYGKEEGIEQSAEKFLLGLKPHVLAAWGACYVARNAAARAYKMKGRSMLAGDHVTHSSTPNIALLTWLSCSHRSSHYCVSSLLWVHA